MDRKTFEVMAPVGSMASLAAALQGGADSVYFGVGRLNMRSHSAGRFTAADMASIAEAAHAGGARAYLTLNTVVYDGDMPEMRAMAQAALAAGVDAVIASDVAVMAECRRIGMPVHLSTQLNIANVDALRFYAQFADVAVLARELTLEQVAAIARAIETERICGPGGRLLRIEMFCHGALCMAYSGRCYMSLHTRGRSANRGECQQPCRRAWIVRDADRGTEMELEDRYILSPRDLKTVGIVDRMAAAGVRVFKIEGRARGPEYVRQACACYREALDCVADGTWTEACRTRWDARLAAVFNRGFWQGWYMGAEFPETTGGNGSQTTVRKRLVGKCLNYFAKPQVGEFLIQSGSVKKGDRILIVGPTTGAVSAVAQAILADGAEVAEARKGDDVTIRVPEKVRDGDQFYVLEESGRPA